MLSPLWGNTSMCPTKSLFRGLFKCLNYPTKPFKTETSILQCLNIIYDYNVSKTGFISICASILIYFT